MLIFGLAFFIAFMMILALAIDGFVLVESRAMLQYGSEYAAEAGLRTYYAQCAAPGANCNVEASRDACKTAARDRAVEVLNAVRMVLDKWSSISAADMTVDLGAGSAGAITFGNWNGTTFTPNAAAAAPNALRVEVVQIQDKLFFFQFTGLGSVNIRAAVIVQRETSSDGLYQFRLVQ